MDFLKEIIGNNTNLLVQVLCNEFKFHLKYPFRGLRLIPLEQVKVLLTFTSYVVFRSSYITCRDDSSVFN